jgi:RNA polymerase sigma-70 factor (ECF subfamily)
MPLTLDAGAVDGARRGGEALERLMATVWPEAFRVALAILRDRGLAEDAAQDACAAIARALPRLRSSSAFSAWAYKTIAAHALTVARRRRHALPLDAVADRATHLDRGDVIDLHRALGTLSPQQRAVTLLHYYAGLRSEEIAAAIGVSASTVRFHLMLARRNLRKALSAPGTSLAPSSEVTSDVR